MLPSKTFAFTQKRVNKLPSTNKTIVYTDQKQINLKLAITACGTKTYFARFKASGVAHNIKIGDAEFVRLDDARARLIELMNLHRTSSKLDLLNGSVTQYVGGGNPPFFNRS